MKEKIANKTSNYLLLPPIKIWKDPRYSQPSWLFLNEIAFTHNHIILQLAQKRFLLTMKMTHGLNDPEPAFESSEGLEEETNPKSPSHSLCCTSTSPSSLYSLLPRLPSFRPKEHWDNNTLPCLSAIFATHLPKAGRAHHDLSRAPTNSTLHPSI